MLLSVVALVPIIWLIIALAVLKLPGHWACFSALLVAAVLSLTLWQMPATDCATSALEGFAAALWPIILVIVAAIFTYNLTLKTGAMDVIKGMLTGRVCRPPGTHPADRLVLRRLSGGHGWLRHRHRHSGRHLGRSGDGSGGRLPELYAGQRLSHRFRLSGHPYSHPVQRHRTGRNVSVLHHCGSDASLYDPGAFPHGDRGRAAASGH